MQKIAFFSRGSDSALSIGVIADVSGSQKEFLKEHRRDLKDFLKTVLKPADQAMLVTFGNSIRLVSPFDREADRLDDALHHFHKRKTSEGYPKLGPKEMRSRGQCGL